MNLLTLFKKNNLDELFLCYLSTKINACALTELAKEIFILNTELFNLVDKIKENVRKLDIQSDRQTNDTIKKIVKILSYTKMSKYYFEFLNRHVQYVNIANQKTTILRIGGILESVNDVESAILKDTAISLFVNNLLKNEDKSKYKIGLALITYFRTNLTGNIRNSSEKYQIDLISKNIGNSLSAFAMDERNLFVISKEMYDACGSKLKKILDLNKAEFGKQKYYLKYNAGDLGVVQLDEYMRENKFFNMWLKKSRENIEVKNILNNFEKNIINFNKASTEILGDSNYVTYKLNYNNLINSVEKAVDFYEKTLINVEKSFKFNNESVKEKREVFINNRKKSTSNLKEVFNHEEKIKIERVVKNVLNVLGEEFNFTSNELKKIYNSREKLIMYQIQFKNKTINLMFNFNIEEDTDCSQISPYYEKDKLTPNYLINMSLDEKNYAKNCLNVEELKLLFHELGHFINMVLSKHGDLYMCKMEGIEVPSIFMEEILYQKEYLEKVIGKISQETYELILKELEDIKKIIIFSFLINGYVHNKIFAEVKRKGDLVKTINSIEKFLLERKIVWNKNILFENDIGHDKWEFSYNKFDYVNVNFVYLLGFIISKKMRESKISMKKAFTNVFNYDMIKIDQCHWSKYVDFN